MAQNILAALGMVAAGIPMMLFAMSMGFKAVPTALGFLIGIAGMLAFGSIIPISIQAGTIGVVGALGKSPKERLSMALFAGLIMVVFGGLGVVHNIIDFAGERVVRGMQAGVGVILAKVAIGMIKEHKFVGIVSLVVALILWLLTTDLVYVTAASVVASCIAFYIKNKGPMDIQADKYKWEIHKPFFNGNVVRGTLALICLMIGSNIAFGNVVAGMAGVQANIDHLTIYSGLANLSALFGGAPVEVIASATGAAPSPMASGIILMAVMAAILLAGLLPKIARYVPSASVAGTLFVIGAFMTTPGNAFAAFNGAERAEFLGAGMAFLLTAIVDPFVGLVAGTIIRLITPIFGL